MSELQRTLENHPNYNNIIQSSENDIKYLDYIKEHRLNVYKAFLEYSSKDEEFKNNKYALYNRILHHDLSKLDIEEFEGCRQKYYPFENEKISEDFYNKSWEHHYTTNAHHPEHHTSSVMDNLDILEMILDWEGVSYKYGGNAKEYYYSKKKKEMIDANLNVNYKYLEEHLLDTDKKGGEELQNIKFSIEDINILQEVSDEQLAICEVYVCASGDNAHGYPISLDTIKEAAPTLLNKFLVADFNGFDFLDHTQTQAILGFFPAENDIRYVEKDNRTFLVANAILSKVYVPYAYQLFVEKNYKSVSMEITVLETEEIEDKTHIKKFVFNGVTVLGDRVQPAIKDASVQIFKFSKDKLIEDGNRFYHNFSEKQKELTNFPNKGENQKISLSNSKFPQFDYQYAKILKEKYPSIWKKGGNIRGNEAFEYWSKVKNGEITEEVLDWIKEREAWMARHEGDFRIAGIIAVVKWGGIIKKGEKFMKDVINEEKSKIDNKNKKFSVDDELGSEESIKIDNSKESAIMSNSWNGQGADFLNKLLKASNHESLLKEAYLIVDDKGDVSINDVHYPHHSLRDGELVINKKGVISAFQRASQQGLSGEPISHLKKHYKELGLDTENFSEGGNKVEENKLKKEEKMAENEKQEESKEEVKEEQMSANENVDGVAQVETLDEEAKENKEQAKEFAEEDPKESDEKDEEDKQEKMSYADLEMKYTESCGKYSDMEVQYAKLKEEHTVMMAEYEALKKFKCEYDEMQKKMAVEETMNYVADVIPETMSVEMREKGMKCSASELMAWSNEVKAKALEFAKPKSKKQNTEPSYIKMGLSELPQPNDIPNDSIWGRL